MTKHAAPQARQKPRSRQGAADKIWAIGLAGATCVGLVGTMGVRAAQEAVASTEVSDAPSVTADYSEDASAVAAVTSAGLSYEQLEQYARALEVERMRLDAYHQELLEVAAQLQESADALSQTGGTVSASTTKKAKKTAKKTAQSAGQTSPAPISQPEQVTPPKAAPKPAAAPQVVQPQAQTRGS